MLFKDLLTLNDILNMPRKELLELKDVRVKSLMDQQKALEKEREVQERNALRNKILSP